MSFHGITADYNGPLEAAHAHMDDQSCDLVECDAAGQPTLDLSYQLGDCSIASMHAKHLSSTNELLQHHRRL